MKGGIYPSLCHLREARDKVIFIFVYKCTFSGPSRAAESESPAVVLKALQAFGYVLQSENPDGRRGLSFLCGALAPQRLGGIMGSLASMQTSVLRGEDGLEC